MGKSDHYQATQHNVAPCAQVYVCVKVMQNFDASYAVCLLSKQLNKSRVASDFRRHDANVVSLQWRHNIDCFILSPQHLGYPLLFWFMMTSSNGNIFRVTGHLCGEFTGPGEFPTQRPVTRSFDVFFDLSLSKRLSKQSRGWWFQTQSRPLWRHCNVMPPRVTTPQLQRYFGTCHDSRTAFVTCAKFPFDESLCNLI